MRRLDVFGIKIGFLSSQRKNDTCPLPNKYFMSLSPEENYHTVVVAISDGAGHNALVLL